MLQSDSKNFPAGTIILAGIFLLVMVATYLLVKPPAPPAELAGIIKSQYRPLQNFELIDSNSAVFNKDSVLGKWNFIFFGYTFCPDNCPTTLHVLDQMNAMIEDDQSMSSTDIQVVFVSVDPARDTFVRLHEYIGYFNRSFIAATGSHKVLKNFTSQFGTDFDIDPETGDGSYNVIHTRVHITLKRNPVMSMHLQKFVDRVRGFEARGAKDFTMSMIEAKDLHADITRLLVNLQELQEANLLKTQESTDVIEVKVTGGTFR